MYGCEVWGRCFHDVETIYRLGVKCALGIRSNTNNEIVYIEAGKHPLECKIKSLQHKFWSKISNYVLQNTDSAIAKILSLDVAKNSRYIGYYINLLNNFSNSTFCGLSLEANFRSHWRNSITQACENDPDSKLGTYLRVNPDLIPGVPIPQYILEGERKLRTRFRTGSHSLAIELGRFSRIPRQNRLCKCRIGIQSVWHIFKECPLTMHIHMNRFVDLSEVFNDAELITMLLRITSLLKVPV